MEELLKLVSKSKQGLSKSHEYKICISDLFQDESVLSMRKYIHHGNINCLEHSLNVSYKSFLISRRLKLDYKSAARGGLLHDFYLYDWHITKSKNGLHGYTHPTSALKNANERFELNNIEKDIILKHMWPLTLNLPKYKESFIICLIDKYCSLVEIIRSRLPKKTP